MKIDPNTGLNRQYSRGFRKIDDEVATVRKGDREL
jgi:hypothetical protein